mmetsp:Transcript_20163/g.24929  ORF Transcript_20163/g.24929 Transcript_20163/m.24929 type:complete len:114 (+) Transcript_20163:1088-1429(+)
MAFRVDFWKLGVKDGGKLGILEGGVLSPVGVVLYSWGQRLITDGALPWWRGDIGMKCVRVFIRGWVEIWKEAVGVETASRMKRAVAMRIMVLDRCNLVISYFLFDCRILSYAD